MILLTGHGKIAKAFSNIYECKIVSIRKESKKFKSLLKNASVVIHNSGLVSEGTFEEYIVANFDSTRTLIELVQEVNPKIRIVYLSSMSILETWESYKKTSRMTPYAYSKYISEMLLMIYGLENFSSVRFSTIFYKDYDSDGLSSLINSAKKSNRITLINNGEAKRDFIPVNILVRYLHKICTKKEIKPIYNIASGKAITFLNAAEYLKALNPDLVIENKTILDLPLVLSDFSKEDISSLGEINFDIFSEIKQAYFNSRNENINF